jgi:hypothetical protein
MSKVRRHTASSALACLVLLATLLPASGLPGCRPPEGPDPTVDAYVRVNYAFRMATGWAKYREREGVYMTLADREEHNPYGTCCETYLFLKLFEAQTGAVLTYADVTDYLSEEHEPDGSLRLYDNGLHPDIEAFVDWAWGLKVTQDNDVETVHYYYWHTRGPLYVLEDYIEEAIEVYYQYFSEHRDEGFDSSPFNTLSPQMYDEVARKMADPAYEMDLLSLQRQGY